MYHILNLWFSIQLFFIYFLRLQRAYYLLLLIYTDRLVSILFTIIDIFLKFYSLPFQIFFLRLALSLRFVTLLKNVYKCKKLKICNNHTAMFFFALMSNICSSFDCKRACMKFNNHWYIEKFNTVLRFTDDRYYSESYPLLSVRK